MYLCLTDIFGHNVAEQEVENLSGLSTNPEKYIFAVRENGTTCLMAEFSAKIMVPYEVPASNEVDWISEEANIQIPRSADIKGKCGNNETELHLSWMDNAYILRLFFAKTEYKCPADQRKQIEEMLPLILGITLGLIIVIILAVYHVHHKMTANQVQIPQDRSLYKHMG
ncbi:hypothetical protein FKM82_010372 [Ascaphus truei]